MPDDRYPLWCVDLGPGAEPERYYGPYRSKDGAEHMAKRLRAEGREVEGVRRCRSLLFSELFPDADERIVDEYEAALSEGEGKRPDGAWANWDDELIEPEPRGFFGWADKHIFVRMFICEGDEDHERIHTEEAPEAPSPGPKTL